MSGFAAPRCQHSRVNETHSGWPALRNTNFCFYHQQNRPPIVDCYYNPEEYATGEIKLPVLKMRTPFRASSTKSCRCSAKATRTQNRQPPALRTPDRVVESRTNRTRKAATRAGCHRCRNRGSPHRRPSTRDHPGLRRFAAGAPHIRVFFCECVGVRATPTFSRPLQVPLSLGSQSSDRRPRTTNSHPIF
jgi:hypothetical protein